MTTTVEYEQIADDQWTRYSELIYDRTGIRVSPQKKTLLSTRLQRRLKATGIDGYASYMNHLSKLSAGDSEWNAFLQEITTHESYLFRDQVHWDWFRDSYLLPMHLVPEGYRRRFFTKAKDKTRDEETWTAKPPLTEWSRFEQHNLLDPLDESPFDLIFLKSD